MYVLETEYVPKASKGIRSLRGNLSMLQAFKTIQDERVRQTDKRQSVGDKERVRWKCRWNVGKCVIKCSNR